MISKDDENWKHTDMILLNLQKHFDTLDQKFY